MLLVVMLVMVLMVLPSVPLVMELVIFGLRKKNREGFRRLVYAATAKSPRASSRFSQKMNVGRCNCC